MKAVKAEDTKLEKSAGDEKIVDDHSAPKSEVTLKPEVTPKPEVTNTKPEVTPKSPVIKPVESTKIVGAATEAPTNPTAEKDENCEKSNGNTENGVVAKPTVVTQSTPTAPVTQ